MKTVARSFRPFRKWKVPGTVSWVVDPLSLVPSAFSQAAAGCCSPRSHRAQRASRHTPRIMAKQKWTYFKVAQVVMPLMPIPVGCYFLYKALKSFNRSPPPIATDSRTVLTIPLYGEPVYQVTCSLSSAQSCCLSPSCYHARRASHLRRAPSLETCHLGVALSGGSYGHFSW